MPELQLRSVPLFKRMMKKAKKEQVSIFSSDV